MYQNIVYEEALP